MALFWTHNRLFYIMSNFPFSKLQIFKEKIQTKNTNLSCRLVCLHVAIKFFVSDGIFWIHGTILN